MFERFNDGARSVVVLAQEQSRELQHDHIGTEHVLLGLLAERGDAARVLSTLGVSLDDVRTQVVSLVGPGPGGPAGHLPFTPRAKSVLELSLREALQLGHDYIGTEHLLLGLIREGEGVGVDALVALGVELAAVRAAVLAGLGDGAGSAAPASPPRALFRAAQGGSLLSAGEMCSFCGRDLWEAEHYVRGESALICDSCVTASHVAIEHADPKQRSVNLPARTFGDAPDDSTAAEAISSAFEQVFGSQGTQQERDALIEDGDAVRPFMEQAAMQAPPIIAAHVSRIRWLGPNEAAVRFTIELQGFSTTNTGRAVRRDGTWLVSRATIDEMIAPTGVRLPPPS